MIGATGLTTDPPDILREVLFDDGFQIIMRRRHRLARGKSAALSELRDAQWVMPNPQSTIWRQIEALFAAENEPWPANCITTNSITALKSLVMRGDFVSIASGKLVKPERDAGHIVCIACANRTSFAKSVSGNAAGQCLPRSRNDFSLSSAPDSPARNELREQAARSTSALSIWRGSCFVKRA